MVFNICIYIVTYFPNAIDAFTRITVGTTSDYILAFTYHNFKINYFN